jgi:hypothetical protein
MRMVATRLLQRGCHDSLVGFGHVREQRQDDTLVLGRFARAQKSTVSGRAPADGVIASTPPGVRWISWLPVGTHHPSPTGDACVQ